MSEIVSTALMVCTVVGAMILGFLALVGVLVAGFSLWNAFLEAVWNAFYDREYRRRMKATEPKS